MSICILDTSVFANIVPVPTMQQDRQRVLARLEDLIRDGVVLLLPMAAILETGNHIADLADGRLRRRTGATFVQTVRDAIRGQAPFTPTPFIEAASLLRWLDEFPDSAMRGIGLADLSIIKEYERQCELHRGRRVFIWSLDAHLCGYDRPGTI